MPKLRANNSILNNPRASRAFNRFWLTKSLARKHGLPKNSPVAAKSFTNTGKIGEIKDKLDTRLSREDYLTTAMKIDSVVASNGPEYLAAVTQIYEYVLSFKAGESAETRTLTGIRDEIKNWVGSLKRSYIRFMYDRNCQELLEDALKFLLNNIFEQVGQNISQKICEGLGMSPIPVSMGENMKDVWGLIHINFSKFLGTSKVHSALSLELRQTLALSLSQRFGNLILLEGEMPFEDLVNRLLVLNFLVPHELGHAAQSGNLLPIETPSKLMPETRLFSREEIRHQANEITIDLAGITLGKWFGVFSPAITQKARLTEIALSNFHTVRTIFNDHVEREVHSVPLMLRMAVVCNGLAKEKKVPLPERDKMQKLSGDIVQHLVSEASTGEVAEIARIYQYYRWIYNNTKIPYASFLIENERWDEIASRGRSMAPALRKIIKDDNASSINVSEALKVLGKIKDKRSVPILTDILTSREMNESTKIEAINALGKIGDPETMPMLEQMLDQKLDNGRNHEIVVALCNAMSKIPWSLSLLKRNLENNTDYRQRAEIARAIMKLEKPEKDSPEEKQLLFHIHLEDCHYEKLLPLGKEIIPLAKKEMEEGNELHWKGMVLLLAALKDPSVIPIFEESLSGEGAFTPGDAAQHLIQIKRPGRSSPEFERLYAFVKAEK